MLCASHSNRCGENPEAVWMIAFRPKNKRLKIWLKKEKLQKSQLSSKWHGRELGLHPPYYTNSMQTTLCQYHYTNSVHKFLFWIEVIAMYQLAQCSDVMVSIPILPLRNMEIITTSFGEPPNNALSFSKSDMRPHPYPWETEASESIGEVSLSHPDISFYTNHLKDEKKFVSTDYSRPLQERL